MRVWSVLWPVVPVLFLLAAMPAFASASLQLSLAAGHPGAAVMIGGTGFAANEAVDIYFDTTDVLLVFTDGSGAFAPRKLVIPASALPGAHWFTGVGRKNGDGSQAQFTVRTNWTELGFNEHGRRFNPYENVIGKDNAASLDVLFRAKFPPTILASPAIAGGYAYIASYDAKLYAFNAATGAVKWVAAMGGQNQSGYSSPAVAKGVVYVGSGDKLYAYNALTGALKWTQAMDNIVLSSPAVVGGVVYAGSTEGIMFAFDAATGNPKWSVNLGGPVGSSPAVADGLLYVGCDDSKLYAIDAATGGVIWSQPTGGIVRSSPTISQGMVYVGSEDGYIYAFSAARGVQQWKAPIGASVEGALAVANGIVYAGAFNGNFYALSANNGVQLWMASTGASVVSSAGVANGVVYVGSDNDKLYAFDAVTGATLWTGATGSWLESSPAISDGVVYVGGNDGSFYAFAINGGNDAVYHRSTQPPSYSTLHPDKKLKPAPPA